LTTSRTGPRARSRLSVQGKTQVVLAVLAGEMTLAEAARRHGVTSRAVGQWRDRFLEAGKASLESRMPGAAGGAGSQTERRPRAEAEQLKLALAEATVQMRIWRKGASTEGGRDRSAGREVRRRVARMGASQDRICAVIDYPSKYCLAVTITPTSRGADALACLHRAVTEATRPTGTCTTTATPHAQAGLLASMSSDGADLGPCGPKPKKIRRGLVNVAATLYDEEKDTARSQSGRSVPDRGSNAC